MAAATTIPTPSTRPITRRSPGSAAICFSAIELTPKESHPEHESNEDGKTRVNQRWRAYIRMESRPNKEPSSEQSCPNPDQSAKHPGREERTDNIDLWSHCSPSLKNITKCVSSSSRKGRQFRHSSMEGWNPDRHGCLRRRPCEPGCRPSMPA